MDSVWQVSGMQFSLKLNSKEISIRSGIILLLSYILAAATAFVVYYAGGTSKVYTNLMYIPITIAASTNGKRHGIIHATAGGLLLGPFMPLDVEKGIMQDPINWIVRVAMYVIIAYVIGFFADHYRQELMNVRKRDSEIFEAHMATIYSLVKLAESRDYNTGEHVVRVAELCRLLAGKLRNREKYKNYINDSFIEYIFKAAPLHDIGKVGIPDSILLKPGKLTPEEFEIMKTHTVIGEETLLEVKRRYSGYKFLEMAVNIARHHHERWDGTGYPDGLTGEDIPLSARIMAVADTYDALRSKRVYKDALSHRESLEVIKQESGTHFDPEIVEVLLECEEEINEMYNRTGPGEPGTEPAATALRG